VAGATVRWFASPVRAPESHHRDGPQAGMFYHMVSKQQEYDESVFAWHAKQVRHGRRNRLQAAGCPGGAQTGAGAVVTCQVLRRRECSL
jgi:hypothetical protein